MKKPHPIPPRLAQKVLLFFLRDDLAEDVLGDLDEKFQVALKNKSSFRAKLNYWYQVFHYARPFAIRKSKFQYTNHYDMFQSYFKIGWRNLFRNKGYSSINIGGLAIGMAVAMIIALWVYDELSFNKYHENYSSIVQITKSVTFEGKTYKGQDYLPYPIISELSDVYGSNFKHIVPSNGLGDHILSTPDKVISVEGSYIGAGAPEMYTLKMSYGNWSGLKERESIMLSQSTAYALFGNVDPLDKDVTIGDSQHVKVTGVFEDLPKNSALYGTKFLAPWELHIANNSWIKDQGWENHFLLVYAEIQPNTTLEKVSENIKDAEMSAIKDLDYMKEELRRYNPQVLLHPMRDWHLYSNYDDDGALERGPSQFVWYMAIIGIFVLTLACINFMNLSTARSEKRAKEVGVRKTMGSIQRQLIGQFFSESFLVVILSFMLAVALVVISLPWFNDFSGKAMALPLGNAWFWISCLVIILVTGLLAGSYPALYLSSFNPVKVLKGTFRAGRLASTPRQILVVMQFTISVMLIICTVVVHNQLSFVKDRHVGYQREGLLMVNKKTGEFYNKLDVIISELKNTGAVTEVSESGGQVTQTWSGNGGFTWKGMDPSAEEGFSTLSVSHDFGRTVGWDFIEGRDFSKDIASDSSGFVINEAAAKIMRLKNPVGEVVHWKNRPYNVDKDFTILGVVKDMVMNSPFEPVDPAIFFVQGWKGWINVRINPAVSVSDALPKIESVFKKVIPSAPFDYKFADQQYATKFIAEERIGKLSSTFSALAIFISCLGLFGLASFVAEQRTKELGIRKVLGASVPQLWKLLSKDFVLLVVIACCIAIPLAFYVMNNWLMQYAYRTTLTWEIFAVVSLGALMITLLTVSFQAVKAALMNPVNSLRSE